MNDEWFADEDAVRNNVGLLSKPASEAPRDNRDVSFKPIHICIITCCCQIRPISFMIFLLEYFGTNDKIISSSGFCKAFDMYAGV